MENKESGSLLLLAGCSEAADAACILLACHNDEFLAKGGGPQQGTHNNYDRKNTNENCHKSMEKAEKENVVANEESEEIKHEEKNNADGDSMSRMTAANGHVPPKLEQPQEEGRGRSNSPQPMLAMLDSLVDLATKELMNIASENGDLSTSTNNNDMDDSSGSAKECGTVLISLKNAVWEKENRIENDNNVSKGSNQNGAVARQSRITRRPRSVSDPEGVNQWGYDEVVERFDAIKEESYENDEEGSPTSSVVNLVLPHLTAEYASTYSRNGRVGIYTLKERDAIINRFKIKREHRIWRKKIRYSCRKSLAEKRARIKGRFVKLPGPDSCQGATKRRNRQQSASCTSQASEDTADSPTCSEKLEEYEEPEICHRVRRHSIA